MIHFQKVICYDINTKYTKNREKMTREVMT